MEGSQMKVGRLSKRTGLTIRTLHHYDQIGLLSPAGRTASGHRLYSGAELRRLQAIASLRQFGLTLADIREILDGPTPLTLSQILAAHVRRLEDQIEAQQQLRARLQAIVERLETKDRVSIDELTETIERSWNTDPYYRTDQLEYLATRKEKVGEDRVRQVQQEWQELFGLFADVMRRGLDPSDEEVLALARRSAGLIHEFTGGDAGIEQSLGKMYQDGGESVVASRGLETVPGLWEYMGRASAALPSARSL